MRRSFAPERRCSRGAKAVSAFSSSALSTLPDLLVTLTMLGQAPAALSAKRRHLAAAAARPAANQKRAPDRHSPDGLAAAEKLLRPPTFVNRNGVSGGGSQAEEPLDPSHRPTGLPGSSLAIFGAWFYLGSGRPTSGPHKRPIRRRIAANRRAAPPPRRTGRRSCGHGARSGSVWPKSDRAALVFDVTMDRMTSMIGVRCSWCGSASALPRHALEPWPTSSGSGAEY